MGGRGIHRKAGGEIKTNLGCTLEIVKHPWSGWQRTWAPKDAPPRVVEVPAGFVVLKRRWVDERTFARLSKSMLMAKDYEYEAPAETTGNLVYEVMIRLTVRRWEKFVLSFIRRTLSEGEAHGRPLSLPVSGAKGPHTSSREIM